MKKLFIAAIFLICTPAFAAGPAPKAPSQQELQAQILQLQAMVSALHQQRDQLASQLNDRIAAEAVRTMIQNQTKENRK